MALTWTDPIINALSTRIKKVHIDEIRAYLDGHINVGGGTAAGSATGHPLANATTHGFMSYQHFNLINSLAASAGTVQSVSGSAPITITGTTALPTVNISPATTSTAGSLSATDKTKLDSLINIPDRVAALEAKPGTGTVTTISGTNAAITITNPTTTPAITIATATEDEDGLLSKEDYSKLLEMDGFPVGTVIMWHGDAVAFSTYFDSNGVGIAGKSFANWKVMWGNINGTPFDMRNIFPTGADTPTNALRTSGTKTFSLNGTEKEGEQAHVLTVNELAEHDHIEVAGAEDQADAHGYGGTINMSATTWKAVDKESAQRTAKTGSNAAHNNMPPFIRLWFLYKYKTN